MRTIWARQRFSATQVTSMAWVRPAIVRSQQCRTIVIRFFGNVRDEEQSRFYALRETKQAKESTKDCSDSCWSRFLAQSGRKIIFLSLRPQEIHHSSTAFPHAFALRATACRHSPLRATACKHSALRATACRHSALRATACKHTALRARALDSLGSANYAELLHVQ